MSNALRESFVNNIKTLREMLDKAEAQLVQFDDDISNNVYESLEEAEEKIAKRYRKIASEACEGSHCLGNDTYEQLFIVDGKMYKITMRVEYNRHDKTYYYVDDFYVAGVDFIN